MNESDPVVVGDFLSDAAVEMRLFLEIRPGLARSLSREAHRGAPAGWGSAMEGGALRKYHLLPSVRGDLLSKLERVDEARKEFERATDMAQNMRERELLLARAKA